MTLPRLLLLGAYALTLIRSPEAAAQIYADVQVSGGVSGTFTITLEHQKVPGTVANFIGLATGEHGWFDLTTGAIRHAPFYNGVTFHRVIAGFMNQTGSRAGDGTDGPGYIVKDEFEPTLRHNAAYTVSMANSGKNTNGSQFFITVAPTPWLDDLHSVFGHVTGGQAVIDQINAAATTGSTGTPPDRPLVPITIQSVNVYGPSLAGFNRNPAWLPQLSDARPVLRKTGSAYSFSFDRRSYSDYLGYHGSDLANWTRLYSGYFGSTAPALDFDVTATATTANHFYRFGRADYSTCATPEIVGNTFHFGSPLLGTAALNGLRTAGIWTFDSGNVLTIVTATYDQRPYSGRLYLRLSNNMQFLLEITRIDNSSGTYTGQTNVNGFSNISGTYTVAP